MSIPDELERRLLQALASTATVISFEKSYLESTSHGYSQDIVTFCERLDRPLMHCMASEVTELNFAQMLVREPQQGTESNNPISLYRAICRALQERESGVVCIYDVEDLPNEAFQLLSRLMRFVRDKKLRWQFLLIGDLASLPPIKLGMLHIDISYPELEVSKKQRLSSKRTSARRTATKDSNQEVTPLLPVERSSKQLDVVDLPQYSENKQKPHFLAWGLVLTCAALIVLGAFSVSTKSDTSVAILAGGAKPVVRTSSLIDKRTTPSVLMSAQLEQAYRLADLDQLNRLITAGEAIDAVNRDGESGLIMAAQASDRILIKELLKLKADPNLVDDHGHTALFYACLEDKADIVKRLLEAGADANIVDEFQKTALTIASRVGSLTTVRILLMHGANSNWQDQQGWTPLFYAAWNDDASVARALLKESANKQITDQDGYTAADIARIRRSKRVASLLD